MSEVETTKTETTEPIQPEVEETSSNSNVTRAQVGTIFMLDIVSQIRKTRFFSFHPSYEAAVLELNEHYGKPFKRRENHRSSLGHFIFDAMQGDSIALIGGFQVVDVKPLISIAPSGVLDVLDKEREKGRIVLA